MAAFNATAQVPTAFDWVDGVGSLRLIASLCES
jgi:hypothetical protein